MICMEGLAGILCITLTIEEFSKKEVCLVISYVLPGATCSSYCNILCTCNAIDVSSLYSQTCQQAVLLQPCNSRALYRLGDAQLSCHDNDDPSSPNAKRILHDAELSYRVSIDQEGCPSEGGEAPAKVKEQQWFKEQAVKKETEKKAVTGGTTQKTVASSAGKVAASTAGRGGTQAGRGSSTTGTSAQVHIFLNISLLRKNMGMNTICPAEWKNCR